ncbi:phage portal protein [Boudabousia marimammalium]|uniref:Phage portal protein n=1 Tax=Boudabousia marimammalium TaxID=156892 RepID=A0A1Q5PP66_9ACTO|nr:phage portal protein [Boudabousia marimammalium]
MFPARRSRSIDQPLSLSSVFRAIMLLQTAVGQIDFDCWRNGETIPTFALIDEPRAGVSRSRFNKLTANSLAQRGEAFWLITRRRSDNVPTALDVLNPLEVGILTDKAGEVTGYSWRGQKLTKFDIRHLKLASQPGQQRGIGPLQACSNTVQGALELREYADNWLDKGSIPPAIFSTDQVLNPDQAKEYKERITKAAGYNRGPLVLGAGMKYTPVLLTPEEMQWIEAQNANTVEIARMFGIPAHLMMIALDQGGTYSNQEQQDIAFVRFTLMAYLTEIEDAYTSLLPRGTVARANIDGFLRTDTKTRYEAHEIGLRAQFLTVAEVREIEKLPALGDTPNES